MPFFKKSKLQKFFGLFQASLGFIKNRPIHSTFLARMAFDLRPPKSCICVCVYSKITEQFPSFNARDIDSKLKISDQCKTFDFQEASNTGTDSIFFIFDICHRSKTSYSSSNSNAQVANHIPIVLFCVFTLTVYCGSLHQNC